MSPKKGGGGVCVSVNILIAELGLRPCEICFYRMKIQFRIP